MNYMTPAEAAKKWQVSLRRVQNLCSMGRIPGVQQVSRRWLIPVNATYPQRSSRKNAAQQLCQSKYHFPFLLFTDYFVTRHSLSEEEKLLLQAQLLFAQGRRTDCITLCHMLENTALSQWVLFGTYFTMAQLSIPMGLYSQLMRYMGKLEHIYQTDPVHQADYLLLITYCKFQYSYDASGLAAIDMAALSPQAIIAYQCITLQATILTAYAESPTALKIYASLCQSLEEAGNLPPACILHAMVGLYYGRAGDNQAQQAHIDRCCAIGCQQGYYELVTKYSSLNPVDFKRSLAKYNVPFLRKLDHLKMQNQTNWRIVFSAAKGEMQFPDCTADESDFLMLLSYGMSNEKIALMLDVSPQEIRSAIKGLCTQKGFQTKAQLVAYAKKIYQTKWQE